MELQINSLFEKFDELHTKYGSTKVSSIYGAGKISNPDVCLVFMNPTAKNVSSSLSWNGIHAPWIGTKNVWRLLYKLNLLTNQQLLNQILDLKPEEWTNNFALEVYKEVAKNSIYISNIAKCTQDDARVLSDKIFKAYRPLMLEELRIVNPKIIITFGNQVSSILLEKRISVSKYLNNEFEILSLNNNIEFKVFPTYYPIGQGTPNISKAISRIESIFNFKK